MKKILLQYKHAIPLVSYLAIYLAWFFHIEQKKVANYQVIHMAIDDHIPFLEIFVIPYYLWFFYIAVVVLFFLFKDKDDYFRTCTFLFTGMTIFLIISTLFPNGHHLRPHVMPRDNFFTALVSMIYSADTPTNLWPSIHVYNSIGVHLAIVKSEHFKNKPVIRFGSLFLCVSIVLSTVFIKQHSVFDMMTAFILCFIMYVVVYRFDLLVAYRQYIAQKKKSRPQIS